MSIFRFYRPLALLALAAAPLLSSTGCMTGVYDGKRVSGTTSSVTPGGYVTAARKIGDYVAVEGYRASSGWSEISRTTNIATSVSWTLADGTKLYRWTMPSLTIPSTYWQSGTGGSFARLRARWHVGTST